MVKVFTFPAAPKSNVNIRVGTPFAEVKVFETPDPFPIHYIDQMGTRVVGLQSTNKFEFTDNDSKNPKECLQRLQDMVHQSKDGVKYLQLPAFVDQVEEIVSAKRASSKGAQSSNGVTSSGSFSGLGEEAVKQPLASLRKLKVLSDQLYKAGSQYRKIAHDSSSKRARSPVDHDPGKIDMLDPKNSDNIDNLEDANRIILALKLQNSELKKSLETARQEKESHRTIWKTDAKALSNCPKNAVMRSK